MLCNMLINSKKENVKHVTVVSRTAVRTEAEDWSPDAR